jgi:tetratricopeptide (TPR) repeat protein/thiol-disulfide isomerase/thioredoxin
VSQSPESSEDENNPEYRRGWAKIFQMIRSGSSWSGHERNCAYLNTGGGNFANISVASGFDFPDDARGMSFGDWDQDGDLDFWVSNRTAPRLRLMRNECPGSNRFLALRLVGNGTSTNRDAIGARVEVYANHPKSDGNGTSPTNTQSSTVAHRPLAKTLRAGEGFLSQNSKWLHFGLGDATGVRKVVVHWPGGEEETFSSLPLDSRVVLVQGSATATPLENKPRKLALTAKDQQPLAYSDQTILRLITPLALPSLPYQNWEGADQQIDTQTGRPILINLWASWCLPCLKELQDFTKNREKIEAAGLNVLALSVDGLGDDRSSFKDALKQMKAMKFPFSTGRATSPLLNALQSVHDLQTPVHRPLPLPSSFLIDAEGRLITIYKGPVNIDEVLRDVRASIDSPVDRFKRAAILAGRTLDREPAEAALNGMEGLKHRKFAEFFQRLGQWKYAADQLQHVVDLWPDSGSVRTDLASALLQLGHTGEAQQQLEEAVRLNPDLPLAHVALAELFLKQKRMNDALEHFDKAHSLQPEDPKILYHRGVTFSDLGKDKQALDDFTEVAQMAPKFIPVLYRRGAIYEKLGEYKYAKEDFKRAIELNPRDAQGYNNLAWLQSTCPDVAIRNGPQALSNAKKACELLHWKDFSTFDTLAAAYAQTGQFSEAVKWQQKALQLAPPPIALQLQSRLELFQAQKPYRQQQAD